MVAAVSSLSKPGPAVDRESCNPDVRSGVVAKTAAFCAAGKTVIKWILPWITYTVSGISEREQAEILMLSRVALELRILKVVKHNIGCRGAGVAI